MGDQVTQAVITVPAYFDDAQRQATRRPVRSPTLRSCASSTNRLRGLARLLDKENDETILVFDLGGGTFDVSLLDIGEGVIEDRRPRRRGTWAATTGTSGSSTGC